MTALKMFRPVEEATRGPQRVSLNDSRRLAGSWPEAFGKQRALIANELRQPGSDTDFWMDELEALSEAEHGYEDSVLGLDDQIRKLENQRSELLRRLAGSLPVQANVAEFLRRDDPSGYLRW